MILIHCNYCKNDTKRKARTCPKCGKDFDLGRKYRVIVKGHDGKRVTKVVESLAIAQRLEAKLKTQTMERRLFGFTQDYEVSEIWKRYLEWAKVNKKSWIHDLQRWTKHIEPVIGKMKASSVSAGHAHLIISRMHSLQQYAPATVKQVLVLTKRIFNWAMDADLFQGQNPVAKVKMPKLNNERTACLTRDEVGRLLEVTTWWPNRLLALLIRFALFSGLRQGEIFKLSWDCVDLAQGFILLKNPKGGKDVSLPIGDSAMEVLSEAQAIGTGKGSELVFPNKFGHQRITLSNSWPRIKQAARLPKEFRFHDLRHTFASYLAASGVSMYTLQKLLTHKSQQMTQRYAHLFDKTLREGVNMISTMIR